MTLSLRAPLGRIIRDMSDDALERELRTRLLTWARPRDADARERFTYVSRLVIEEAKQRGIRV